MLSNKNFECRVRSPPGMDPCLTEAQGNDTSIQLLPCTVWCWEGYCPNSFRLTSYSWIIYFPWHVGCYTEDVSCLPLWLALGRSLLRPHLSPQPHRVASLPLPAPGMQSPSPLPFIPFSPQHGQQASPMAHSQVPPGCRRAACCLFMYFWPTRDMWLIKTASQHKRHVHMRRRFLNAERCITLASGKWW